MDKPLASIITVMLTPSSFAIDHRRNGTFIRFLVILGSLTLIGSCAHGSRPQPGDRNGQSLDLEESVREFGKAVASAGFANQDLSNTRQVVVIKDRHATHGAITRTRGPLRRVQSQNQAVVAILVNRGFALMGCESPLGPLPTDTKAARAHRAATVEALNNNDRLEGLTLYQPIVYEELYRGTLAVVGVEDPELYASDKQHLVDINRLRLITGRNDVAVSDRRDARRGLSTLVRAITKNARARGDKAASNLLNIMQEQSKSQAILLIGGAHANAAIETLQAAGVSTLLFECKNYREGL